MIETIRHLDGLNEAGLPRDGFAIVHSAWLTIMGMRPNGDLDLIMTSALRRERFPDSDPNRHFGLPGRLEMRIRFQPHDSPYGGYYGARGIDDVIANHCVEIDGFRFVEPRFYFEFKRRRLIRLDGQLRALPWWRRKLRVPVGVNRKLFLKIQKDNRDFAWLEGFFARDGHRRPEFAHIPDRAWGLPGREWRPADV